VHELISKRIEPAQHDAQNGGRVAMSERGSRGLVRCRKTSMPLRFREFAISVIPEVLVDVLVVEQQPDAAGELIPHELLDSFILVEAGELLQELAKRTPLRYAILFVEVGGIGRVERDPQEDEMTVDVLSNLFGAV